MTRVPVPIALFTYNRPEHTKRMLASLAQCSRLDECTVHIYCDASRTPTHQAAVEETRLIAAEFAARLGGEVILRETNLGLARSIVDGVTSLVRAHGRVIVLEDDLVISPDFLDYMLQGLERYANAAQVYQISGFCFPITVSPATDTFFLPLATTWGWATWARAWQAFEWDVQQSLVDLSDRTTRRRFDVDDSYPYTTMLKNRLAGRNDSWGILWWLAIFKANGLVLYPRHSLVRNDGFDGSGVHPRDNRDATRSLVTEVTEVRLAVPLTFPHTVEVDLEAWLSVKAFLRRQRTQHYGGPLVRRLRNKLGVLLKGVRS